MVMRWARVLVAPARTRDCIPACTSWACASLELKHSRGAERNSPAECWRVYAFIADDLSACIHHPTRPCAPIFRRGAGSPPRQCRLECAMNAGSVLSKLLGR